MFPTYAKMRISEDLSALHCQKCGCELIRQIATPAFHLKGAGFHSVDYKGVK